MELTKKQKIYVLNEMIRYYKNKTDLIISSCGLLSQIITIDLKLKDNPYNYRGLSKYFPEFFTNKPKGVSVGDYWWPSRDSSPRLEYCKKILKIVEKSK